jgi:CheY-like chemotaxis protein
VDDTADIVDLLALVFRLRGCETFLATDGREAIDQAAKHEPDLILIDIRMPFMDGYEATRRIHGIPYLSNVPVIAMSAHCEGQWYMKALEAGCVECIAKPIDPDRLDQVVSRYVHDC